MPTEGAKWVKKTQNWKKTLGSRQKNSQKSTKNKKTSFPRGFLSEEDLLSLSEKIKSLNTGSFLLVKVKLFFFFFSGNFWKITFSRISRPSNEANKWLFQDFYSMQTGKAVFILWKIFCWH